MSLIVNRDKLRRVGSFYSRGWNESAIAKRLDLPERDVYEYLLVNGFFKIETSLCLRGKNCAYYEDEMDYGSDGKLPRYTEHSFSDEVVG